MYVEGQIILGKQTALKIPAKSVVLSDGHNSVFIIHKDASGATVNRQKVQVGQIKENHVQILSGISKSDRIVLEGAGFLNDGDIVRVTTEKGAEE